ncbi:hypothetical protein R1480_33550 [Rhizobium brockwellii]|nr:hypothetical protein [Rhizobium brockwellii]MDV4159325.1 hypothetical protein [Rhizobium brockwellii]
MPSLPMRADLQQLRDQTFDLLEQAPASCRMPLGDLVTLIQAQGLAHRDRGYSERAHVPLAQPSRLPLKLICAEASTVLILHQNIGVPLRAGSPVDRLIADDPDPATGALCRSELAGAWPCGPVLALLAYGLMPAPLNVAGTPSHMDLRYPIERQRSGTIAGALGVLALHIEAARIHALAPAGALQRVILVLRPRFAPGRQHFIRIPLTRLYGMQSTRPCLAQRQQHMRMEIARVIPLLYYRLMQGEIRYHAPGHELLADEGPHQIEARSSGNLVGQRHIYLTRKLCIAALLDALSMVPEKVPVCHPRCCAFRQQDLGVGNPSAVGVIVNHTTALIAQPCAGAIRSCGNGGLAGRAFNDLHAEVIRTHHMLQFSPVRAALRRIATSLWPPSTYVESRCISALLALSTGPPASVLLFVHHPFFTTMRQSICHLLQTLSF